MQNVVFKAATSPSELEQIHRLNHKIFAEELGQYETNSNGELVDRFHSLNRYFVAERNGTVIGMISLNSTAPFSIEKRLGDPAAVLARYPSPCEIRMLAITGSDRNSIVLAGLFWQVFAEARSQQCSHLLISGKTDRAKMYHALGFRDLGPSVPAGGTSFIPMAMTIEDPEVLQKADHFLAWWKRRDRKPLNLMPGPVQIADSVRHVFEQSPVSHRTAEMVAVYGKARRILRDISGGMSVALMTGSGTLANDTVAACLRARFGDAQGLVLANGEFGQRLQRQGRSARLNFDVLEWNWGERWDFEAIEQQLQDSVAWVWCVHLETSTGQLNDLERLSQICEAYGVALAVDCVSSLGAVPLESCKLSLASGVSGKALGSYAGIAMVFADDEALAETPFDKIPATFDIAQNIRQQAPMYTIASPQLRALHQALIENYLDAASCLKRYEHYCVLGSWVRASLRRRGVRLLVDNETAAPTICTFPLTNKQIAQRCKDAGFYIAHESSYLEERSWGQISVMGDLSQCRVEGVFDAFQPFS